MRRARSSTTTFLPAVNGHPMMAESKTRKRQRRPPWRVFAAVGAGALLLLFCLAGPRRAEPDSPGVRRRATATRGDDDDSLAAATATAPPRPRALPAQPPRAAARRRNPAAPVLGVVEEHHAILGYLARLKAAGGLARPATLLHVDSHADLGVPRPFPGAAPPLSPARALEAYAEPNDWILLAALAGLVDRVVFVEPPWSNQLRCCLYDTNATFSFVVGLDRYGDVRVDVAEGEFVREHFGHVFWRDGEWRTGDSAHFRQAKRLEVTVVAADHGDAPEVVEEVLARDDGGKPLVVDVDLTFFAVESPGSADVRERYGLRYDELETLYHLAWDFPRLDAAYFKRGDARARDEGDAKDYGQKVARKVGGFVPLAGKKRSHLAAAFERALGGRNLEPWRLRALTDYAARLDVPDRPVTPEAQRELELFLEQPFHVPSLDRHALDMDYLVGKVVEPILDAVVDAGRGAPALVVVARSPGYAPPTHLHETECRVLNSLARRYRTIEITHEARVDARRTACARVPDFEYVLADGEREPQ